MRALFRTCCFGQQQRNFKASISLMAPHADVAWLHVGSSQQSRVRSPSTACCESAVHRPLAVGMTQTISLARKQLSEANKVSRPNQRSQLRQGRAWAAAAALLQSPMRTLLPTALSKPWWHRACPLLLASFALDLTMFWPISRVLAAEFLVVYIYSIVRLLIVAIIIPFIYFLILIDTCMQVF